MLVPDGAMMTPRPSGSELRRRNDGLPDGPHTGRGRKPHLGADPPSKARRSQGITTHSENRPAPVGHARHECAQHNR